MALPHAVLARGIGQAGRRFPPRLPGKTCNLKTQAHGKVRHGEFFPSTADRRFWPRVSVPGRSSAQGIFSFDLREAGFSKPLSGVSGAFPDLNLGASRIAIPGRKSGSTIR